MEKPLLKEIWRNELAQWNKGGWKGDLSYGLSFTLTFIVFSLFYFFNESLMREGGPLIAIVVLLGGCIMSILTFLSVVRYFLSYIIIYENGIALRKPTILLSLKTRFIPFEDIADIDYVKIEEDYRRLRSSWVLFYSSKEPRRRKTIQLRIFFRDRKPYVINSRWVSNYRKCINLVLNYKNLSVSRQEIYA
ncbi:MAG: hypothetical protein ACTSP9_08570 [Promethearchaeota archaeon]